MGLSTHERHVLGAIESRLAADSDPGLTVLVTGFNRLATGEALPEWEKIRPGKWQLVLPLLWFAISIALIAVTLTIGRGSTCPSWATACATQTQMPSVARFGYEGGPG